MIKSATLTNFQSHPNTTLNFHPGINTIIGDSDKGKTGILRALLWSISNRPSGLFLASDWIQTAKGDLKKGEEVAVHITTDSVPEGITRARRTDFNGYVTPDGTLEAIRTDVPQEVKDFFNIDEVNIQRQMDAPFLLSYSPGEASRFINRLIKLEVIDNCLQNSSSRERAANQKIKHLQDKLAITENDLGTLDWVSGFTKLVEVMEEKDASRNDLSTELVKLEGQLNEHQRQQSRLMAMLKPMNEAKQCLTEADRIEHELLGLRKSYNATSKAVVDYRESQSRLLKAQTVGSTLEPLLDSIKALSTQMDETTSQSKILKSKIAQWDKADTILKRVITITEVQAILSKVKELDQKRSSAAGSLLTMELKLDDYQVGKKNLRVYKKNVMELEAELERVSKRCPTCGQIIRKEVA